MEFHTASCFSAGYKKTMRKPELRYLLISLLLMIFSGQSLTALALPCHAVFTGAAIHTQQDPMSMGHSMHHDMDQAVDISLTYQPMADKANTPLDCCKTSGHCASGNCSQVLVGEHVSVVPGLPRHLWVDIYLNKLPMRLPFLPYRPPILG